MNTSPENREIDAFFDWLKPRLKMPKLTAVPPPPSDALLKLVRESAAAYGGDNSGHPLYEVRLTLLAADDGSAGAGAVSIPVIPGKCDLHREIIPDDPDRHMLRFKCRDEHVAEFLGLRVQVDFNGRVFNLGEVNRRGIAETKAPSGLDLSQAKVRIDKPDE